MPSQTLKSLGHIKCSSFSNYLNLSKNNFTFRTDCMQPLEFSRKKFTITNVPNVDHANNHVPKNFLQNYGEEKFNIKIEDNIFNSYITSSIKPSRVFN